MRPGPTPGLRVPSSPHRINRSCRNDAAQPAQTVIRRRGHAKWPTYRHSEPMEGLRTLRHWDAEDLCSVQRPDRFCRPFLRPPVGTDTMRLEEIVSPREIYDVFEVVVPRDRERTGAARRHKMVVHRAIVRKPAIFGGLRCSSNCIQKSNLSCGKCGRVHRLGWVP